MKPDQNWIEQKYNDFNIKYFNGKLGSCTLKCQPSNRNYLGIFTLDTNDIEFDRDTGRMSINHFGNRLYVDSESFVALCCPLISLNTNYDAPESSWENTLIHEMCHYYTYMDGYVPKQGHGKEFKAIARRLYEKTNGEIVITTYDKTGNFTQTNQKKLQSVEKRKNNKIDSTFVALTILSDNSLSLQMLKENTLKILLKFSKDFVIYSSNNELITKLFERGFNRVFRTLGRYWSITDPRTIDLLNQYEFIDKNGDTAPSIKYLLGMEDDNNNNIFNSNNDWHLNYKIIHDQNGYNLINKQGKKVFNVNVDSIIFDENKQLFIMKFGKYTKIGKPGNWENLTTESRNNYIKNIIRETILNQLDNTEYTESDNDNIGHITPDMNLSLYSPYELQQNTLNESYWDDETDPVKLGKMYMQSLKRFNTQLISAIQNKGGLDNIKQGEIILTIRSFGWKYYDSEYKALKDLKPKYYNWRNPNKSIQCFITSYRANNIHDYIFVKGNEKPPKMFVDMNIAW